MAATFKAFKAEIFIIGVNPYVLLPEAALQQVFKQAGKEKGTIPVCGTIDGHKYIQTLVKYAGHWRLYLNTPMRKAAGKDVGDEVRVTIAFDPRERNISMPPKLAKALEEKPRAKKAFDQLSPSRRKEIIRYIANLKSETAIDNNVKRAIGFLQGKGRFVGRDKPA